MGKKEDEARKKIPLVLTEEEKKQLLSKPNPKAPTGLRNLCMLKMMLETGLRLSEITGLQKEDIDFTSGKIIVKAEDKERIVWTSKSLLELLQKWRQKRPHPNSPFFFSTLKGGKLDERYVREMVNRLGQKIGIEKNISPQTLRHTFAFELYRQTRNISMVQQALGHSSLSSTMIYAYMVEKEEAEEGKQFFRPKKASA